MARNGRSRNIWLLLAALLLVGGLTSYFTFRSFRDYIFFSIHADEPIQPWMRIGFVAHSYHLPPYVLEKAIGLPYGPPPDHRSLGQIAKDTGVPFATLKAKLETAIVHSRPPYPPPGPPPVHTGAMPR